MKLKANGIDIEVEDTGAGGPGEARPVVLLIMGLGMQLIAWPEELVQALVAAGYRVIRHDNRDIGLSQHFDQFGAPNFAWALLKLKLGLALKPPYGVGDMAADSIGVLDALNVPRAHVVGASMGGMIAQRVALAAPSRVASLTSVMSTSGARGLPRARPEVMKALMRSPARADRDTVVDHTLSIFKLIGSPGFPTAEHVLRERLRAAWGRSFHPVGVQRQMLAILADRGRADELRRVAAPTLVFHGTDDPLIPCGCGEDTARRIPGAKWVTVKGMAHDLAPGVVERLLASLVPHLQAASRS